MDSSADTASLLGAAMARMISSGGGGGGVLDDVHPWIGLAPSNPIMNSFFAAFAQILTRRADKETQTTFLENEKDHTRFKG